MTDKAQYKLMNHQIPFGMGNVRAVITDRKFTTLVKDIFLSELVTTTDSAQCCFEAYQIKVQNLHSIMPISKSLEFDKSEILRIHDWYYYAFGAPLYGRKFASQAGSYRFGFNGQEKDDEVKGNGNSYDFGARIYDSRLGRWLGCDPLQAKYPNMSPYNYCANNPIKFVDYDGKDYGVIVDKESKTIIIVSNIFTVSEKSFQQASAAASELNSLQKNVTLDGVDYALSFEVKIFPPITDATGTAFDGDYSSTPYSNVFYGTTKTQFLDGSNKVEGGGADGSSFQMYNIVMPNAKYKEFNDTYNMGDYPQLVGHEMLHTMGLDDEFNRTTGKPQPYYSEDGRMNYVGTRDNKFKMNTISNQDIKNILQYAIDKNGTDTGTDPKAIIWEDSEDFPLQSASEINVSDTPATK